MLAWDERYITVTSVSDEPIGVQSLFSIRGKVALVTGASRGIGRAAALLFAQAGADVAISYGRNQKAADEVLTAVGKQGRRALAYKADMASRPDIDRMVGREAISAL